MLKTLIIGADAVCPEYIFDHPERYPNLSALASGGASGAYSAYVQKGYHDSYLSEMNWASIYTGLAPWEHRIALLEDGCRRAATMGQFDTLSPFWKILNNHGLSVGLWTPICCADPVELDGYTVVSTAVPLESPQSNRIVKRTLQVCEKDKLILDMISEEAPPRLYPRTLAQQGYIFEDLRRSPALAWEAVQAYHFQDALENFREELEFFFQSICAVQRRCPVDVLYFYTPTTDLIGHCAMYRDDSETLTAAYQLLDQYVGRWVDALQPENTVVLSDHGMCNFKDLVQCEDEAVRREAFAARDEVIWLPNGYIAFEAHNGAILFTAHALKGTFIAGGHDIRHTVIEQMRTLDVYPTLLELMGVRIPDGRAGFVEDIFNRGLVNQERLLPMVVPCQQAAVLQCCLPSVTDIVLNELYVHNRFTQFTVIGEEKYREIFLHNPRVRGFVPYEAFDPAVFDEVYCGIHNGISGLTRHVRVR
nr:alkaline phosphatase family protein [uncultured Oscillibacter sp.]